MHEIGLAASALRLALSAAQDATATRVLRLELEVGVLSGVDPQALRFALETSLAGTPAAGAAVVVKPVPAVGVCAHCQSEFRVGPDLDCVCPGCGRPAASYRGGRELTLARLELEFSDAERPAPVRA